MVIHKALRVTWVVLGGLSLLVGFIGIFVPLLPTAPFVLLAGFCFSKGSERLYQWLLELPYVGEMMQDWKKNGAIPIEGKIACGVMLSGSIAYLWIADRAQMPVRIGVTIFLAGVIGFVLSRPTASKSEDPRSARQ